MELKDALVTGASGRLGTRLIKELVDRGIKVRALVSKKESLIGLPSGVVPFVGDIKDKKVLNEACEGVDTVFHLAAVVSQYKVPVKELVRVNVDGTNDVIEACKTNRVRHIIFASSVDVYGNNRKEILTEESKTKPTDMYGHSKMMAEDIVKESPIPYTILRFAAIYGPGFEKSFFKIFRVIKEEKAYIIGNGSNHLPIIHVNDAVQALIFSGMNSEALNKIYNVSDGEEHTQEELFNVAADMLKVEKPKKHMSALVVKIFAKKRGLDSDELRFITCDRKISIEKITKDLGYKPKVSILKGSEELIREFNSKHKR